MLLLATFNPRPQVSLRLLTSRSPALPLGAWLVAGGAGGALLSALATALALRERPRRPSDRGGAPMQADRSRSRPIWPMGRDTEPEEPRDSQPEWESWPQAGPERGLGDPAPTVSVPFRVLRGPQRPSTETRRARAAAAPVSDTASVADDWNAGVEEDW